MSGEVSVLRKIAEVFQEVQLNRVTHKRRLAVLTTIYDATPFDDFFEAMWCCIQIMFQYETDSEYVQRSMQFASEFIAKVAQREDAKMDTEDIPTHPLIRHTITDIVQFLNLEDHKKRFHACNFITFLLDSIGENANLDNDLCDIIQAAMLQRIRDSKWIIRVRAVKALQRLQDPTNRDCPVIEAYLISMRDLNSNIRATVIKMIGPSIRTIPRIVESVQDQDPKVRLQAFTRCAQMPPNFLKIIERQFVLQSGFSEEHAAVRKIFRKVLLPKWLASYDGNLLQLLKAIKLDADEKDVEATDKINNSIIEFFLGTLPINDLVSFLPLGDNKLILYDQLVSEVVSFWSILYSKLIKNEVTEDIAATIIPELLPFCKYIDDYITEHQTKDLELWQFLEYQFILLKLFELAREFDMSDQVGRTAIHQLVVDTLTKTNVTKAVSSVLLTILERLTPDIDSLVEEVLDIIRNIMEPPIALPPTQKEIQERNFILAELNVKINILGDEIEDLIKDRKLKEAADKEELLKLLVLKKNDLQSSEIPTRQERQSSNDPSHKCKCLDVFNSMLELKSLQRLTPALKEFRHELISNMENHSDIEQYRRAFRSCCLLAIHDRECADEYLKLIYSPILTYHFVSEFDIVTLQLSISMMADLIYVYGEELFKKKVPEINLPNTTISKRKLYNPLEDDIESNESMNDSPDTLIDTMLSMLDCEIPEIREVAGEVMCRIIIYGTMVSSSIFSRVLLKWSNPLTNQASPKIQSFLGLAMYLFSQNSRNSQSVIEEAIIPTLNIIGNAPKTSPLADINIDEVISCIIVLITPVNQNTIVDTHKSMAYLLCNALDKNLEDKCAVIWGKMLMSLQAPQNDIVALEELKGQVEGLLEDVNNAILRTRLKRYLAKLSLELNRVTLISIEETTNDSELSLIHGRKSSESEKRPANTSESDGSENNLKGNLKNPKKKLKLADNNVPKSSGKRFQREDTSSQDEEKLHEGKRQKLDENAGKCIDSDEELELVARDNGTNSVIHVKKSIKDVNPREAAGKQNKKDNSLPLLKEPIPSLLKKPDKSSKKNVQHKITVLENVTIIGPDIGRRSPLLNLSLKHPTSGEKAQNKKGKQKNRQAKSFNEKTKNGDSDSSEDKSEKNGKHGNNSDDSHAESSDSEGDKKSLHKQQLSKKGKNPKLDKKKKKSAEESESSSNDSKSSGNESETKSKYKQIHSEQSGTSEDENQKERQNPRGARRSNRLNKLSIVISDDEGENNRGEQKQRRAKFLNKKSKNGDSDSSQRKSKKNKKHRNSSDDSNAESSDSDGDKKRLEKQKLPKKGENPQLPKKGKKAAEENDSSGNESETMSKYKQTHRKANISCAEQSGTSEDENQKERQNPKGVRRSTRLNKLSIVISDDEDENNKGERKQQQAKFLNKKSKNGDSDSSEDNSKKNEKHRSNSEDSNAESSDSDGDKKSLQKQKLPKKGKNPQLPKKRKKAAEENDSSGNESETMSKYEQTHRKSDKPYAEETSEDENQKKRQNLKPTKKGKQSANESESSGNESEKKRKTKFNKKEQSLSRAKTSNAKESESSEEEIEKSKYRRMPNNKRKRLAKESKKQKESDSESSEAESRSNNGKNTKNIAKNKRNANKIGNESENKSGKNSQKQQKLAHSAKSGSKTKKTDSSDTESYENETTKKRSPRDNIESSQAKCNPKQKHAMSIKIGRNEDDKSTSESSEDASDTNKSARRSNVKGRNSKTDSKDKPNKNSKSKKSDDSSNESTEEFERTSKQKFHTTTKKNESSGDDFESSDNGSKSKKQKRVNANKKLSKATKNRRNADNDSDSSKDLYEMKKQILSTPKIISTRSSRRVNIKAKSKPNVENGSIVLSSDDEISKSRKTESGNMTHINSSDESGDNMKRTSKKLGNAAKMKVSGGTVETKTKSDQLKELRARSTLKSKDVVSSSTENKKVKVRISLSRAEQTNTRGKSSRRASSSESDTNVISSSRTKKMKIVEVETKKSRRIKTQSKK